MLSGYGLGLIGLSFIVARWIPLLAWKELQRRGDERLLPIDPACVQREICSGSMPKHGCRACRKKFAFTCLLVQGIAACATGVMVGVQRDAFGIAIGVLLIWVLLLLSLTDLWSGLLPNRFTYTAILLFALLRVWSQPQDFWQYGLSFVLTGVGMMAVSRLTRGLGAGDAKLLAMSAWLLESAHIWVAFFLATVTGTVYVGWRWLWHHPLRWGEPFAFAPHLAVGIFVAYLWGKDLWDWYWMWFAVE